MYRLQHIINSRHKVFTLIELLVVIAIIAILASMLMPALGQARERGRKASCQSQIKQIGSALYLYFSDYDDFFPLTPNGTSTTQPWTGRDYAYQLNPYVAQYAASVASFNPYKGFRGSKIFYCPSRLSERNLAGARYVDYGCNMEIGYSGRKLTGMRNISRAFLCMDSVYTQNSDSPNYYYGQSSLIKGIGNVGRVHRRHLDQANILYGDGHTESLSAIQVSTEARFNALFFGTSL